MSWVSQVYGTREEIGERDSKGLLGCLECVGCMEPERKSEKGSLKGFSGVLGVSGVWNKRGNRRKGL